MNFFQFLLVQTKRKTIRGEFLPTFGSTPILVALTGIPFLTDILGIVPTMLKVHLAE